jgi:transposase
MPVIRIGLDVAKNVFQAHGVDEHGRVVLRKQLRRREVLTFFASLPPCLIGIEACSASHYWARELTALGHQVRMMPARYVKPYVQRGKSDALDAAAICEAVSSPTMRFAAIKSVEQQSALTLHRAREILVKQETMLANLIRGCLGEFGIVAPLGIRRIAELVGIIRDETDSRIPPHARIAMTAVADQLGDLQRRIKEIEQAIRAWHRNNDASRRLATIPGVGIITAWAIAATVATPDRVQVGPPLCSLSRADTKTAFDRRPPASRAHLEAGRRVYPPTSHPRRNSAGGLRSRRRWHSLGQAAAGPSGGTRRHRCPR